MEFLTQEKIVQTAQAMWVAHHLKYAIPSVPVFPANHLDRVHVNPVAVDYKPAVMSSVVVRVVDGVRSSLSVIVMDIVVWKCRVK
jgi:hypothetical protein